MPQGINSGTRIFSTSRVPDFRCTLWQQAVRNLNILTSVLNQPNFNNIKGVNYANESIGSISLKKIKSNLY